MRSEKDCPDYTITTTTRSSKTKDKVGNVSRDRINEFPETFDLPRGLRSIPFTSCVGKGVRAKSLIQLSDLSPLPVYLLHSLSCLSLFLPLFLHTPWIPSHCKIHTWREHVSVTSACSLPVIWFNDSAQIFSVKGSCERSPTHNLIASV